MKKKIIDILARILVLIAIQVHDIQHASMRTCAQNSNGNVYAEIEKIVAFTQQFYGCHYSIVRLNSTFAAVFRFFYGRFVLFAVDLLLL